MTEKTNFNEKTVKPVNIFARYAKDKNKECVTGAKFYIDRENDCYINVKRWSYANRSFMLKFANLQAQLNKNEIDEDQMEQLGSELFIKELVCGWNNIADENGNLIQYTPEASFNLLRQLPDLVTQLRFFALSDENYALEQNVKN